MPNLNYTSIAAVYAVEQLVEAQNLVDAVSVTHPILPIIKDNGHWNNPLDFTRENSLKGTKAVVPVLTALGDAEGVTKSGQYTPMSLTETSSGLVSYAEYPFTTYRG